jgi:hypothetical protein
MKKLTALVILFALVNMSFIVSPKIDEKKSLNAKEIMIPIGKTGNKISLLEFSKLKPNEYEKLAKVKLNFFDRVKYKMAMKKLKKSIAEDGTITNKKVAKAFADKGTDGSSIGGFALGFLVGLIGVLIAYLINDDKKSNRVKWAWIGFGVILVIYLLVFLA